MSWAPARNCNNACARKRVAKTRCALGFVWIEAGDNGIGSGLNKNRKSHNSRVHVNVSGNHAGDCLAESCRAANPEIPCGAAQGGTLVGAYAYAPKPRNFSHSTPLARSCDNVRGRVFFSPCIFVLLGSGKALWGKALGGTLTCVRTHTHVCAFFTLTLSRIFRAEKPCGTREHADFPGL